MKSKTLSEIRQRVQVIHDLQHNGEPTIEVVVSLLGFIDGVQVATQEITGESDDRQDA